MITLAMALWVLLVGVLLSGLAAAVVGPLVAWLVILSITLGARAMVA